MTSTAPRVIFITLLFAFLAFSQACIQFVVPGFISPPPAPPSPGAGIGASDVQETPEFLFFSPQEETPPSQPLYSGCVRGLVFSPPQNYLARRGGGAGEGFGSRVLA